MNMSYTGTATADYRQETQVGNRAKTNIPTDSLEAEVKKSFERFKQLEKVLDYTHIQTAFENGTYEKILKNAKEMVDVCTDFVTKNDQILHYKLIERMNAGILVRVGFINIEIDKRRIYDQRFIDIKNGYQQFLKLIGSHYPHSTKVDATFITTP